MKPQLQLHQFLGSFTFPMTVYYTNILRGNWTIFVFIEGKSLLYR